MPSTDPVFEKPAPARPPRRILLITYHFAPGRAVGALRWQKLSALLHEQGWGIDVISAGLNRETRIDAATAADLPPGIRIYPVPSPEQVYQWPERLAARLLRLLSGRGLKVTGTGEAEAPSQRDTGIDPSRVTWDLSALRTYTRLYLTARDQLTSGAWKRRIVALGRSLVRQQKARGERYDVIVTSGPPHAWHNAGVALSHTTGIPLVLDLRDPWSAVNVVHEYFATPLWLELTKRQERRAVEQASLIVNNTGTLHSVMAQLYPHAVDRMITVMNGSDEDPLESVPAPGSRFRIGYAGVIYLGRDPRPLFDGLGRAVRDLGVTPGQLQLELMGDVERYGGRLLTDIARDYGVDEYLAIRPPADRQAALRFMSSCHMLVSLPWNDSLSIPAKIYEYMRFPAWLLVFARPESALADLLKGSDADVISPDDPDAVGRAFRRRYLAFRSGDRPAVFDREGRFSRRRQARILVDALNGLVEERPYE